MTAAGRRELVATPAVLVLNSTKIFLQNICRDGQLRIIYYSRIVKPNPESELLFFAMSTINMKAFITSLQQPKHNQRTSLLQCNTFKLSTCLPVCAS